MLCYCLLWNKAEIGFLAPAVLFRGRIDFLGKKPLQVWGDRTRRSLYNDTLNFFT